MTRSEISSPVSDEPRDACSRRVACFHCGETCSTGSFAKDDHSFCCNGCLTVYEILTTTGLGHFYDLNDQPGVRIRSESQVQQWAFLDEPAIQQQLLDFTDGKQSRVTFHIPAIHCIACVWLLENLFQLHPGIGASRVNFARREVAIAFASAEIKLSELVALLARIGYEPSLTLGELEKRTVNSARKHQWLQIGVAGFAFGNIMLFSLPQYVGLDSFNGHGLESVFRWLSLALALPVVTFSAADYWKSALLSLRQRTLTLDVPIVLGLAAIYGRSLFEVIFDHGGGYCDSLTGLIFFLLCGRVFQQKTHERLAFDRDYKSFFPLSVARKSQNKNEERISLSQLAVGDRIVVRNGELIPADAQLVNGPALIDYSFVTGESEPLKKNAGDHVYAGGRQIGAAIELETTRNVSQSYLTSLWNHEMFQKDRDNNFETMSNRYGRWFTVIVIAIALGAALFWMATGNLPRGIKAFASVLIVACPCALALAAPFTLGTAQRWLVRWKVFLKSATVLERLARVDTIVFDKTGTLTSAGASAVEFISPSEAIPLTPGFSRVTGCEPLTETVSTVSANVLETDKSVFSNGIAGSTGLKPGVNEKLSETEKNWIYSLTRHSTHPHSVRISAFFGDKHDSRDVESFRETPGCGIEARVEGREIWIGSEQWLKSRGVCVSQTSSTATASAVHVAIDGNSRGAFLLKNSLRPEISQLVERLTARYDIALLSGDNERERESFRTLFGENAQLHFNQSPLDKLSFIQGLQRSGRTVMMVGDGLNDAGALRQSDVGVAVVENVGAFSPASDVILDAARVPQLHQILTLARRSAWIVRVSFGISAVYNIVGVSIAAAGLLSPLVCAVLMPLSSISVVLFACGITTFAARHCGLLSNQVSSGDVDQTLTPALSLSERERENDSAVIGEINALIGPKAQEVAS